MNRRSLFLLVCFLLLSFVISTSAEITASKNEPEASAEITPSQSILVAENDHLAMSVELETCTVTIFNKADNTTWSTNPADPQEDEYTIGPILNDMRSQLVVTYYDKEKNTATIGTYLSSVLKKSYEIKKIQNGIRITYSFSRQSEQFSIPLEFCLDGDAMNVTIPVKDIKEYGEARISEIQCLPFLMRGGLQDEGYLLIPDGSGALIDFKTIRQNASPYKQKVYGRDLATSYHYDEGDKKAVRLPVYGTMRNESGIFAIINGNESSASVEANPIGAVSSMANACASFTYRQMDTALIAGKDWNYNEYPVVNTSAATRDFGIRYVFLNKGKATYGDMAEIYRSYLQKTNGLVPLAETDRLDGAVEFFGKTTERRSFLGIPYEHTVVATDFKQVSSIINDLQEAGSGNLGIFLYGFDKGGYPHKIGWDRSVGGQSGYESLRSSQEGKGSVLYGVYDFLYEKEPSFLWLKQGRYARTISRTYLNQNHYSLSTYALLNNGEKRYGLTEKELTKRLVSFVEKTSPQIGMGAALESIGSELYSDYGEKSYTERQSMAESFRKTMNKNASLSLAATGGNAYVLGTVRTLYEIPTDSSHFDWEKVSIPFYTMVLHGYVNMAAVPLNMQANDEEAFLRCIEAGALPSYRVTGCDNLKLKDTEFNFLYNTGYTGIQQTLKKRLKAGSELYQDIFNQPIISHNRNGNIAVTTYGNGTQIAVNYGTEKVDLENTEIPARGFARIK